MVWSESAAVTYPLVMPDHLRPMRSTYHFGTLLKEVNFFAYPRTGGHFFYYCLSGLFDLVVSPHQFLHHEEALDRQNELNPDVLYALDLREPDVPYRPVRADALVAGVHATPID